MKKLKFLRILLAFFFLIFFLAAISGVRPLEPLAQVQFGPALLRCLTGFSWGVFSVVGTILVLTLLFGRLYCSIFCPLGILQDLLGLFPRKFHYSLRMKIVRYPILTAVLALAAAGVLFPLTWLLPSSNFVMMKNSLFTPEAGTFLAAWGLLGFLLILVRWRGRIYCNTLCPVGAILALAARFSLFKIRMKDSCVGCGKCEQTCKAACIDAKNHRIRTADCVGCMNCLAACPFQALTYAPPLLVKVASPQNASAVRTVRRGLLVGAFSAAAWFFGKKLGVRLTPAADAMKADSERRVLPPGAGSFDEFRTKCVGCGLCVGVCQGHALTHSLGELGLAGTLQPFLDFNRGKCEPDCTACMAICPTEAIPDLGLAVKKRIRLGIGGYDPTRCRAFTGEDPCGECEKACPVKAISLVDFQGKKIPKFNDDLCVGCGACQFACPVTPKVMQVIPAVKQEILEEKKDADEKESSHEST